ncbi:hypothetical protein RCL1_006819 [Eukaryota sp. TZLM3-RCL]
MMTSSIDFDPLKTTELTMSDREAYFFQQTLHLRELLKRSFHYIHQLVTFLPEPDKLPEFPSSTLDDGIADEILCADKLAQVSETLSQDIIKLKKELKSSQIALRTKNTEVGTLSQTLVQAENSLKNKDEQIANFQKSVKQFQDKISLLTEEKKKLVASNSNLRAKFLESETNNNNLIVEISELKKTIHELKQKLKRKQSISTPIIQSNTIIEPSNVAVMTCDDVSAQSNLIDKKDCKDCNLLKLRNDTLLGVLRKRNNLIEELNHRLLITSQLHNHSIQSNHVIVQSKLIDCSSQTDPNVLLDLSLANTMSGQIQRLNSASQQLEEMIRAMERKKI